MITLVQLRESRGWRPRHVAELLGVSPSTVGAWERGDRAPSIYQVTAYADLFPDHALALVKR